MTSHAHPLAALISAALIGVAIAPLAAHAAPDDKTALADFFTGTLEIDTPAGNWSAKRWLAADHTYRETGSDGEVRGTWSIENGKICTTAARPLGDDRAKTHCNIGVGKKAGETWRDDDPVTGNAVLFDLKPGR
jgi:hypothetical protein